MVQNIEINILKIKLLKNMKNINNFIEIIRIGKRKNISPEILMVSMTSIRQCLIFLRDRFENIKSLQIRLWFREQSNSVTNWFLTLLHHNEQVVRLEALEGLFEQFTALYTNGIILESRALLLDITRNVIVNRNASEIKHLFVSVFNQFEDVRQMMLMIVKTICEDPKAFVKPCTIENKLGTLLRSLFTILISFDLNNTELDILSVASYNLEKEKYIKNIKICKKILSSCWLSYLKQSLPLEIYEKVLSDLVKIILPNVTKPLLLADFLIDSYNLGGLVSLLALNDLFYLMKNYNLDYPNFYPKLYNLLTPVMLNSKICCKFLELIDIFLSSTFLPNYMIYGFSKKLSLLALRAPVEIVEALITIVSNLITRYPCCKSLIQKVKLFPKKDDIEINEYYPNDPFIENTNLKLCRAFNSSLWEVQSLKRHYNPVVSKTCSIISQSFIKISRIKSKTTNLKKLLKKRYISMAIKDLKKKKGEIVLEYRKSKHLFQTESIFSKSWDV